jgi:hypothetical protein
MTWDLFEWLIDIYILVVLDRSDEAIDVLFREVDGMLLAGEFERCDQFLQIVDLSRLDTELIVGVLSVTLKASDKLPSRAEFFRRVSERFRDLPTGRAAGLLRGLE